MNPYVLAVSLCRELALRGMVDEPKPGDLVFESTHRRPDPDAIGWLIGHGPAPYGEDDPTDGSVPTRDVWDIRPLNPDAKLQTIGGVEMQRWENAWFYRVYDSVLRRADLAVIEGRE